MECNAALPATNQRASALLVAGLIATCLIAFSTRGAPPKDGTPRYEPIQPHFTVHGKPAGTSATDSRRLLTLTDASQVIGWISGDEDCSGKRVTVTVAGKTSRTRIGPGNVFRWKYSVAEPVEAGFSFGELTARVLLDPASGERTVFFVTDRPVYRPGQVLRFAGFLRRLAAGETTPIAGEEVPVRLVSQSKVVAAEIQLTSDDFGRIEGEYRFHDTDVLDAYQLSITGYRGTVELKLAEPRKPKVRLAIDGQLDGHNLELRFRAVDFLGKPMPGVSVRYAAHVTHSPDRRQEDRLEAEGYVLHEEWPGMSDKLDAIPDDLRRLHEVGELQRPVFPEKRQVANLPGELEMGKEGVAEDTLILEEEWTDGNHHVVVEGLLLDGNGHEQRSVRVIPLGKKPRRCELRLDLDRSHYGVSEDVLVGVRPLGSDCGGGKAKATVVVMKLSSSMTLPPFPLGIPPITAYGQQPLVEVAVRQLVTAVVVPDASARLSFDEPGAYVLVGVAELADGRKVMGEVGLAVDEDDAVPAVTLDLDSELLAVGERISGELHTAWPGADVLLSIRDSRGVRWVESFKLETGAVRFRQPLPANLGYGSLLEARVVDGDRTSTVRKFFRVDPTDRMIRIDVSTREVHEPGAEVKVDLALDRAQEVDLVVSVFDGSLVAASSGKSIDVRDFYLADDTVDERAARDVLRSTLGAVTVKSIADRADALSRENKSLPTSHQGGLPLGAVEAYRKQGKLKLSEVNKLLNFAGVDSVIDHASPRHDWRAILDKDREETSPASLIELLDRREGPWQVKYRLSESRLVLTAYNPDAPRLRQQRMSPPNQGGDGSSALHFPASVSAALSQKVRRDFSDSAYWNAHVRTDKKGRATVGFRLPDSLTHWRVAVTAISPRMHVGQATADFRTFKPVMVWPMAPRTFARGDRAELWASVHNRTPKPLAVEVSLEADHGKVLSDTVRHVTVPAESNLPVSWTFEAGAPGLAQIQMSARSEAGADTTLQRLPVTRFADEQVIAAGDMCGGQATIDLPENVDLDNTELEIVLASSLADDLVPSLDDLVVHPFTDPRDHSTEDILNYRLLPATRVAQVLRATRIENRELEERLTDVVETSIRQVLEQRVEDGSWRWYRGQGYEMTTPAAVHALLLAEEAGFSIPDETAIERGLVRVRNFIDSISKDETAERIYMMYVYARRHEVPEEWWTYVRHQIDHEPVSEYALALALEMLTSKKKGTALEDDLVAALQRQAKQEKGTTYWNTVERSHAGDRFEVTATVLEALVAHDPDHPLIAPALAFFAVTRSPENRLSMRVAAYVAHALFDYLATRDYHPGGRRTVAALVNDGPARRTKLINDRLSKITVPGGDLRHGTNTIDFEGCAPGTTYRAVLRNDRGLREIEPMNHGLVVQRRFYTIDPDTREDREIQPGGIVRRGSYIKSKVDVQPPPGGGSSYAFSYVQVENPKPANCEIVPVSDDPPGVWQGASEYTLREERTAGVTWHHEQGRWSISDTSLLHAEFAGEYVVAPARAEMVYDAGVYGHSGTFWFKVE